MTLINSKFEAFKLKQLLKTNGVNFDIKRKKLNEFNEILDEDPETVTTIIGVYHEQSTTIKIQSGQTTQYRTKKTPMILCGYTEELNLIKPKDIIHYNNKSYVVQGIVNYMELNIIMDISLEVVDQGGNQL